ncbi:MAG: deoxyribonuclease IV [Candidatus Micrarchaeia archaeon]
MKRVGYHVSITGGIENSFDYAKEIGCTTMQIFLSSPRIWTIKKPTKDEIQRFIKKDNDSDIEPVFVHMPYLPNIASPKIDTYKRSIALISEIVDACSLLKIEYLILHLGSYLGEDKNKGMERVISAVNTIKRSNNGVSILLENQAGQKNSVGSDIKDLNYIYKKIKTDEKGLCLDTCHLFAAGYDIRKKEVVEDILREFGSDNIKVIHLNDAKHELGSFKDRHERIGSGYIGIEGFKSFFSNKKICEKDFILETPRSSIEEELSEIKIVKSLIQ